MTTGRYLTAREAGWLLMYGQGMGWHAIATATYVSTETIKSALTRTRRRWDVASNSDLVLAAMRAGVLA